MKSFFGRIIIKLVFIGGAICICILSSATAVYFYNIRWTTAFNWSTFALFDLILAGFLAEAIVKSFNQKTASQKPKSTKNLVEKLARVFASFF